CREFGDKVESGSDIVELIMWPQVNCAAKHSRLSCAFAHLHISLEQREARTRIAGTIDVGIDVALKPSIELSLDFVGGAEGAHHVSPHDLEEMSEARRAQHRVDLGGKAGIGFRGGGGDAGVASRSLHAA